MSPKSNAKVKSEKKRVMIINMRRGSIMFKPEVISKSDRALRIDGKQRLCVWLSMLLMIGVIAALLIPVNSFAWWSETTDYAVLGTSVHKQISEQAYDLVRDNLSATGFLKIHEDDIVAFTSGWINDETAHGGNSARNGGDINLWFNSFVSFKNSDPIQAATSLGYCIHLIEDMNVPAHAYNIPHAFKLPSLMVDEFEEMADQILNDPTYWGLNLLIPQSISISQPRNPILYYWDAKMNTELNIVNNGYDYWEKGQGEAWNGDGPKGQYGAQEWPTPSDTMSPSQWDFLVYQLNAAVKYVAMFLLETDRNPTGVPTLFIDGGTSSTKAQDDTFTLTGSNYTPNRMISRYVNGSSIGTIKASGSGAISWTLPTKPTNCATVPGSYTVYAKDNATGKISNTVTEVVTAKLSCSSTVTITANDSTATEAGVTTGQYTVTRTGATTSALTVYYGVSGTATSGSDYNSIGTSVTIPAGSSTAMITVTPINDTVVESNETVVVTLSANAAYTVGSPSSATVTITSDDTASLPTVTITANDPTATEAGPTTGQYTVTRTGATTSALTVYYGVSGTATSGSDYNSIGTSVTIPAGSSTAMITVTPINDTVVESNETVVVTLSANAAYTVGSPSSATVTITSDDTAGMSLGEAVDNATLPWTTGGNANWAGQTAISYNGGDAAQSGTITNSQSTWVQTTVTGPGTLSFYWKVSSESGYDYLRFYIDGVEQSGRISGEVNWAVKTYTIASGSHTLKWAYTKDGSVSSGSDKGWLDYVVFTGGGTLPGSFTLTLTPECSGTTSQIRLNWTTSTGAASYDIYRNGTLYASGVAGTQYINTSVTAGTSYSYYVEAKNSYGATNDSNGTLSATAPTGCGGTNPGSFTLSGSAQCSGSTPQILLSGWGPSGATTFDVYRNGSLYSPSNTGPTFLNTPVTAGTTYSYYVVAKNAYGSTTSNTISVTAPTSCATPALSITTTAFNPATATVGVGYGAQAAIAATGGQTPYSCSATGLPSGMAMNSTSCALYGTPTVSGTFNVTVTVYDSSSPQKTASKVLSLTVAPATTLPDLVVTALSAPSSGTRGSTIYISATVANQGTASSVAYRLGLYFSLDSNITTGDTIAAVCNMSGLSQGVSGSCAGNITVPSSLPSGTYYFGAIADDLGAVSESNEGNNTRATGPITIY